MPRHKKKSLLTRKKISKRKPTMIGIPADSEWKSLAQFGSFLVDDEEGNQHKFNLNETAFILPHGLLPDQKYHPTAYWIGRIKEIRARNPEDVWALVQWFWSPHEVATVIKSFDVSSCGQYERIYSDYHDYVSTASFCDHATVKSYDERSLDQEPFDDDHFFRRYDLEYRARRILPNVSKSACICGVSYNPDRDQVMHFCPRPTCCLAFHQECLLMYKQHESNTAARARRLLECWPDTDKKLSVETLIRRGKGSGYSMSDPLKEFPEELLQTAQQQIVKGVQAGGVVGNVKSVVAARRLIYKTLIEGSILPVDWMSQVDVDTVVHLQDKGFPVYLCPECRSAI
ncbi:hypothetical protein K503DRAFT_251758 [Rhizopogon vinicolor AM-OR11-026]|uniref:BAH domain-containing protein n=1 Tax=Rhizopogon vinicolor AM-OR11-026 TaxID=1314800 RepID=A0A1B7MX12_9AGAM|nr:hypothetical protein K503DRAFT_251758 [Rhizopogon vinicolor AM-OR11-026]